MKCGYRNCEKEVEGNKIYCSRTHKEYEKKYRNRKNNPKPIGRPKSIWKLLGELNEEDIKKLMKIYGNG